MEQTYVNEGHLGGYVVGGDEATWYPDLWNWLITNQKITSVLDIGCGEGQSVRFFAEHGINVLGVDGIKQEDQCVFTHDFTKGKLPRQIKRYDMVWCCEFVEHVEEEFLPNILDAFQRAPLVLMTHADPGQQGHHHVNCRKDDYWVGAMAAVGYYLDNGLTARTRLLAGFNTSQWNHYRRSGLVFRRSPS